MAEQQTLSDETTSALVALVRQRQALIKSTARADRAACDAGIDELYRLCNRAKPEKIWCNTPLQAVKEAGRQRRKKRILPFRQLTTDLGLERGSYSRITVERAPRRRSYPTALGLSQELLEAHGDLDSMNQTGWSWSPSWAAGSVVPAKPHRGLVHNLTQCVERSLLEGVRRVGGELPSWANVTHSAEEIIHFTPMELIDRLRGVDIARSPHAVINAIIHNCGHFLPREGACFLSERPSALRFSENGDLHAEGEPAISYSAGFMHYFFWNGIPVPETVGLIPSAAITPDYIRGHSTWLERNILIARMGLENFLAESDAIVTHEDETGKLWKARFGRGNTYSWSVVEVINGSPEPDGKFKHYFLQVPPAMRTARQAVAWTYGLAEDQYQVAMRT